MKMSKKDKVNLSTFQATVLTHLDYIKEKQDLHDKTLSKLFDRLDNQVNSCAKRFNVIEKDVDTTKGFAKGAMAVGGIGGLGGFVSIILRFLGMR